MYKCAICEKQCKNLQSLSSHITFRHKEFAKEQYYNLYIKKDTDNSGICPICGNKTPFNGFYGYQLHCSLKCAAIAENTRLKRENTNIQKYGTNYNFQNQDWKDKTKQIRIDRYGSFNNVIKYKQNFLQKYGVDNPAKVKEIQEKLKKTSNQKYGTDRPQQSEKIKNIAKNACQEKYGTDSYFQTDEFKEKSKQTCLEKYGVENPSQADEIKNKVVKTCQKKYGYDYYLQVPEVQGKANSKKSIEKMNNTKRKNKTFNTSTQEDLIYKRLLELFNKNNIKRNYNTNKYPFNCDFYIKSLDLYIECNFHWTHGGMKYDGRKTICKQKLAKWKEKAKTSKYYQNAISVWTHRDIQKYKYIKKNKLNYIIFWNIDEALNWIGSQVACRYLVELTN